VSASRRQPPELDLGPRARAFREDLRAWLAVNRPDAGAESEEPGAARGSAALEAWGEKLRAAGYLCITWPEAYGGRGLSGVEAAVMNEEFARAGVPRVTRGMGETLVGPAIIVHGTEEQKARLLPRILSGEERYCQGFSEPGAGSDLASLAARGVVDGDELVVTGQKVWTSWYWDATMLFCLCRTDPGAEKHGGISYVLIPIRKPDGAPNGVEFRPIRQITGQRHFAETFLDGARAPLANVIGGLGNGWAVTKTTLGSERGGSATTQHTIFAKEFWKLVDEMRARGRSDDPVVRQQLAWAYTQVEVMRFQGMRLISSVASGADPDASASIHKMFWSEYARRFGEIAMNLVGADALVLREGGKLSGWQREFLGSRGHTIWGGTAEIQRNIVAERVLGLPREPHS
jgi:alkylation response protein AidB-like acyl-CoA dehydrogenase